MRTIGTLGRAGCPVAVGGVWGGVIVVAVTLGVAGWPGASG